MDVLFLAVRKEFVLLWIWTHLTTRLDWTELNWSSADDLGHRHWGFQWGLLFGDIKQVAMSWLPKSKARHLSSLCDDRIFLSVNLFFPQTCYCFNASILLVPCFPSVWNLLWLGLLCQPARKGRWPDTLDKWWECRKIVSIVYFFFFFFLVSVFLGS